MNECPSLPIHTDLGEHTGRSLQTFTVDIKFIDIKYTFVIHIQYKSFFLE